MSVIAVMLALASEESRQVDYDCVEKCTTDRPSAVVRTWSRSHYNGRTFSCCEDMVKDSLPWTNLQLLWGLRQGHSAHWLLLEKIVTESSYTTRWLKIAVEIHIFCSIGFTGDFVTLPQGKRFFWAGAGGNLAWTTWLKIAGCTDTSRCSTKHVLVAMRTRQDKHASAVDASACIHC